MAKRGGFPGGGMPGNMSNLMKQAQRMQRQMEESAKELETAEFTATAGGGAVEVTVTGKKEVTKVKLDPEAVDPDDVEMLEDLQRDFPDVDVQAEITRIRKWQAEKRTPIRNVWRFLRTWLSNAKAGKRPGPEQRAEKPVSVAVPQPRMEAFPPSPEALAENWERGLAWCSRILNRGRAAA